MQETLSSSTLGVESEEQSLEDRLPVSHHLTSKCVRADTYTEAGVGCRGELVAEFASLAGLLWHRN